MAQKRVVFSLEQAVALPSATLRFVQLGWRVIRIEPTPTGQGAQPGDPNRYAGRLFADEGRRSFFVPPNVGKETIALNLKSPQGKQLLDRLLTELRVDIFCTNVLPAHHFDLGVDYDALARIAPQLIWASISAMGTQYPEVPGYDPIIQAMSGLMSMTGFPDGPPVMSGVQITDLKAGDELYANVLLALLERAESGRGKRIDISMLQAATSWLVTVLPNVDISGDPDLLARSGNFHRVFVPTGVYKTQDGFLYVAIGNTLQWRALIKLPAFADLENGGRWDTLAARSADRKIVRELMAKAISSFATGDIAHDLRAARIPHSRINTIREVHELPAIRERMPSTKGPDGKPIRLAPAAVDLPDLRTEYDFAPAYGEHTDSVLSEVGLSSSEIRELRIEGIIA
jgi:itaconate CoA-transferase